MRRLASALGGALGLVVILVGAPWALAAWGRIGDLARIDWAHAFVVRDDGHLMLGVLSLLGWLAWLALAISIIVETVEVVDRVRAERTHRPHRPLSVPGLDLPRLLVRGLVVSVVTAGLGATIPQIQPPAVAQVLPATTEKAAPVTTVAPDGVRSRVAAAPSKVTKVSPTTLPTTALHVVAPGETLESLATRYYGDSQSARIAEANADILKGGALQVGQRLVIPGATSEDGTCVVVVRRGDSLSVIAARYLGDGNRWREVQALNTDVVTNPSLVYVGWRLRLPTGAPASAVGAPTVSSIPATAPATRTAPTATDGATADAGPATSAPTSSAATSGSAVTSPPATGSSSAPTGVPQPSGATTQPSSGQSATAQPSADQPATTRPSADQPTAQPSPEQSATSSVSHAQVGPGRDEAQASTSRTEPVPAEPAPSGATPSASSSAAVYPGAQSAPSTAAASGPAPRTENDSDVEQTFSVSSALAFGVVGTVGVGMAAGVVRAIRRRRDVQLALRPVGRRIPYPASDSMRVESALTVVGVAGGTVPEGPVARRGIAESPWAEVTAGFAADGPLRIDLEAYGIVSLDLGDAEASWGAACAWALELVCRPDQADGSEVTGATVVAVGDIGDALAATGLESIEWASQTQSGVDRLLATVAAQRHELSERGWTLDDARHDPDAREAWWPTVFVFGGVDPALARQLELALSSGPRTAVSAVVVCEPGMAAPRWGARIVGTADAALLEPAGASLRPVSLTTAGAAGVIELLGTSGSQETVPAPWFAVDDLADNVLPLLPRLNGSTKEAVDVGDDSPGVTDFSHPTLMLLGPIQLLGAAGAPPARAERSCIEYCAWMVEHPGATASQMAASLLVAETTRRSNVSRLRGWLGVAEDGTSYLPEAYTGRLYLDTAVSSDWHRLQTLITPGINRVGISTLVSALRLVRGAPLADAAPGQWQWAEELRTDMVSTIRDIGARVGEAALADGDIDLARWAAARALAAAPGDEILMRLRLRTEHQAGNRPDVERIVLQLTRHARQLGIDLDDETVRAIQEAIEGQPRARA